MAEAALRVAIFGNPNCGKTSVFNALTGSRQRVGNYPGVTVEQRSGRLVIGDQVCEVVDLPGSYGFNALSPEAQIAQTEVESDEVDCIVFVVDAMALTRGLLRFGQLSALGRPMVLCLNMADQASQCGQQLDLDRLSEILGIPVVETVGHRRIGVAELRQAIADARPPRIVRYGSHVERQVTALLRRESLSRWQALRKLFCVSDNADQEATAAIAADNRRFADDVVRRATVTRASRDLFGTSDKIDRVAAHRWLGIPLFLLVMYGVFWIAFSLGEHPMAWIEGGIAALSQTIAVSWSASYLPWLRSLCLDGVIAGVGGVLVFVPNIVLLFICLSLLEDTGYLARVAFLIDRVMQRFGLPGKAFIPLLSGFGCSIPGIMATRVLEDERDRKLTMFVLPLISCGARLPIWMLLVPAFFAAQWRAAALWSIYTLGVVLALALPRLLRCTTMHGVGSPLVLELPPYRWPTPRQVMHKVGERAGLYLRKAGTVILGISVLMWFASTYPKIETGSAPAAATSCAGEGELCAQQQALAYSLAGRVGRTLEPVFEPAGYDWRIVTALIGAFAAKEVFVAQMGIVYAVGGDDEENQGLAQRLSKDYSVPTALSLIVFLLVATPCMATLAITRRESGSWRWALFQFGGLTALGYFLAVLVFQLGQLAIGG